MACLHHGENRTKLVDFREQKKIVCFVKPANLAKISPQFKLTVVALRVVALL
jgi:hypothetical protein